MLLGDDADHLENLVRVAPLVIVPCADLDERLVELDAGLDVENGRACVIAEVGGDDSLVGVAENALELALAGGLHRGADLIVGGFLLELAGEVDEGDVARGNADGHAGELAVESGENLADGLGRARGGRDHVLEDAAATAPILLGGAVNGLLRGGGGVDRRHEAALDAERVVEDLGDRRKAVRGAGSVGDDVLAVVGLVVDAVDEHRGGILGGRGHDDLLGASLDVHAGLLVGEEETGGLDDDFSADLVPLELGRILLGRKADLLAVDNHRVAFDLYVLLERAVDGIVLEHVCEVIGIEKIVDADDLDVVREVIYRRAENHAADAAEAVDANLDSHLSFTPCLSAETLPTGN